MPDDNEIIRMIDDCENRESRLIDWERDFISAMADWSDKGRSFTPKQADLIEMIWENATANG